MQLSHLGVPFLELWMSGSFANSLSFESSAVWNTKVSGTLGRGHQYTEKSLGPWDQKKGLTLEEGEDKPLTSSTQIPRATSQAHPWEVRVCVTADMKSRRNL